MVSVTYGIRPSGGHATGWTSPRVVALLSLGVPSLIAFWVVERRADEPMFRLQTVQDPRVHVRHASRPSSPRSRAAA